MHFKIDVDPHDRGSCAVAKASSPTPFDDAADPTRAATFIPHAVAPPAVHSAPPDAKEVDEQAGSPRPCATTTAADTIATLVAGSALLLPTLLEVAGMFRAASIVVLILCTAWYCSTVISQVARENDAVSVADALYLVVLGRCAHVIAAVAFTACALGTAVAAAGLGHTALRAVLHEPSVIGVVDGVAAFAILVMASRAAAAAMLSLTGTTTAGGCGRALPLATCTVAAVIVWAHLSSQALTSVTAATAVGSIAALVLCPVLLEWVLSKGQQQQVMPEHRRVTFISMLGVAVLAVGSVASAACVVVHVTHAAGTDRFAAVAAAALGAAARLVVLLSVG